MRRMMLGQAAMLAASLSIGTLTVRREAEEGDGQPDDLQTDVLIVRDSSMDAEVPTKETRQQRRARERREAKLARRKVK